MPKNTGRQFNFTLDLDTADKALRSIAAKGTTVTAEFRRMMERHAGLKAAPRAKPGPKNKSQNT